MVLRKLQDAIKEQINKINAAKKQHEFTKVKLSMYALFSVPSSSHTWYLGNRRKELKEEESKPEPKEEEERLKKKLLKSAIKRAAVMHEAVVRSLFFFLPLEIVRDIYYHRRPCLTSCTKLRWKRHALLYATNKQWPMPTLSRSCYRLMSRRFFVSRKTMKRVR
jgi:hypothetical protein